MSHITLVDEGGSPFKGIDGRPIQYTPVGHDKENPTGFTHGTNLECRKCHGKFGKLLTKANMCKTCYRSKDAQKK